MKRTGDSMTREEEKKYLAELEGVAKTSGQSTPTDRYVVVADLVLYHAIKRLDSSSKRLFIVNIALTAVMLLVAILQLWRS